MEISTFSMLALLLVYGGVLFGLTWLISQKTGVEGFIVANRDAHYGWSASTMSAVFR